MLGMYIRTYWHYDKLNYMHIRI